MSGTRFLLGIAFATLTFGAAHAITFIPGSKPDPFAAGKTCDAAQVGSMGGYVYDWPSKYDLIFSPVDYPMFLWRCETSGYVSFPNEFDKFAPGEKERIGAYLAQAKFGAKVKPPTGFSDELLQHLEKIYGLRDNDVERQGFLLRYFAWQYRAKPVADEYRRKAVVHYKALLDGGTLKDNDLLETLYILGFYSYKLGNADAAKNFFDRLKSVETVDPESKKPTKGSQYLEKLASEVLAGKADDKVRFADEQN
jgi:hypothetical protein